MFLCVEMSLTVLLYLNHVVYHHYKLLFNVLTRILFGFYENQSTAAKSFFKIFFVLTPWRFCRIFYWDPMRSDWYPYYTSGVCTVRLWAGNRLLLNKFISSLSCVFPCYWVDHAKYKVCTICRLLHLPTTLNSSGSVSFNQKLFYNVFNSMI